MKAYTHKVNAIPGCKTIIAREVMVESSKALGPHQIFNHLCVATKL